MIPTEYEYLIRWIRSVLHGTSPDELPAELSFQKIYDYAMAHDVANMAFYAVEQLKTLPDEALFKKWRTRRDLALARDMNQAFAREEIVLRFRAGEIPFLELQGTVLKELYPRREQRTMSDLDFIVEKSRLEEAGAVLEDLGYHLLRQGDVEIDGMRKPNIYVELHTEYFPNNTFLYGTMGQPDLSRERTEAERMQELYLYNMIHAAKHYFGSGCGIRRVLDVYLLEKHYGSKLCREEMDKLLQEAGIPQFSKDILALAQQWFGEGELVWNPGEMAETLLLSSVQGDRTQFIQSRITDISGQEEFRVGEKVKYLLYRLFPDGRVMHKHYPYLKKWPVLYPFCWIHRGLRLLFGKKKGRALRELKTVVNAHDNRRKRG